MNFLTTLRTFLEPFYNFHELFNNFNSTLSKKLLPSILHTQNFLDLKSTNSSSKNLHDSVLDSKNFHDFVQDSKKFQDFVQDSKNFHDLVKHSKNFHDFRGQQYFAENQHTLVNLRPPGRCWGNIWTATNYYKLRLLISSVVRSPVRVRTRFASGGLGLAQNLIGLGS